MTTSPEAGARSSAQEFTGFPSSGIATAVPSIFFSQLMPLIEDEWELRVTLYVIYALGRRKGTPRFVTERELRSEAPLMASMGDGGDVLAHERLRLGLELAVARASLIRVDIEREGRVDRLYLLNTPANRMAEIKMRSGISELGRPLPPEQGVPASKRENVFQLYEENIGPLTPLVAEELREAEQLYPYEWLEEALREAALLNKRSWRYAARILERWATEGRKREKAGRDPGEGDSARAQFLRRYRDLGGSD